MDGKIHRHTNEHTIVVSMLLSCKMFSAIPSSLSHSPIPLTSYGDIRVFDFESNPLKDNRESRSMSLILIFIFCGSHNYTHRHRHTIEQQADYYSDGSKPT